MLKYILLSLVSLLIANATYAENIGSRYGAIVTSPGKVEGSFIVSFEGKQIAVIEAESVSLNRVTPNGEAEYIVIEKWLPGLHCHTQYMVLTIHPDKRTQLSPSFGECMELQGATYLKQGVKVSLRSPSISGVKQHKARYIWSNGKLSQQ
jgi:hypothetical protein